MKNRNIRKYIFYDRKKGENRNFKNDMYLLTSIEMIVDDDICDFLIFFIKIQYLLI